VFCSPGKVAVVTTLADAGVKLQINTVPPVLRQGAQYKKDLQYKSKNLKTRYRFKFASQCWLGPPYFPHGWTQRGEGDNSQGKFSSPWQCSKWYGAAATTSRLLEIIGLFCKRAL